MQMYIKSLKDIFNFKQDFSKAYSLYILLQIATHLIPQIMHKYYYFVLNNLNCEQRSY